MVFHRLFNIFSDPFFWVLVCIFGGIGYCVYRFFVVGDMGYDEETAQLDSHLEYHGFEYLDAERQPVFEDNTAQYSVKAKRKEDGGEVSFMARIEYANSEIVAVQWEPSFEEVS